MEIPERNYCLNNINLIVKTPLFVRTELCNSKKKVSKILRYMLVLVKVQQRYCNEQASAKRKNIFSNKMEIAEYMYTKGLYIYYLNKNHCLYILGNLRASKMYKITAYENFIYIFIL